MTLSERRCAVCNIYIKLVNQSVKLQVYKPPSFLSPQLYWLHNECWVPIVHYMATKRFENPTSPALHERERVAKLSKKSKVGDQ